MDSLFRRAAEARRAGRSAEAEEAYRAWIAVAPDDPAPRYGLSTLLLARGEHREGWGLYEARTAVPETGVRKPRLSFPEWRGEVVSSLLVWPEQGLGDQIMFARFIPELVARGIAVTLVAPPALVRLFGGLGATVIEGVGQVAIPRHDAWCLIGSLPLRLGCFPAWPYLPSPPGGHGIGIMARGNPAHVNDANRSLPPDAAADLESLCASLAPEVTGAKDFLDTASLIADLELVVSVDTAIAHLAGAMGKPTLLLLSSDPDWRWGVESRTPLYPSMTILRQRAPGDWSTVLEEVSSSISLGR